MLLSQRTHPCGSGISLWRETGGGWHGMATCLCHYLPLWTCSCLILDLPCPSYKGLLLEPPFLKTLSLIEPSLWHTNLVAESLAPSFIMYSIFACPREYYQQQFSSHLFFFIAVKYTNHKVNHLNHFCLYNSVVISTFILLGNHYHHPSPHSFHPAELKLCAH